MDSVTTLIYSATWLTGVAVTYAIFCLYVACMRWRFPYNSFPDFDHYYYNYHHPHHHCHILPLCCLHVLEVLQILKSIQPIPYLILIIITIIKMIITRGSSLDRDLDGFPLNQVEVDQRGHDQCVIGGEGDGEDLIDGDGDDLCVNETISIKDTLCQ